MGIADHDPELESRTVDVCQAEQFAEVRRDIVFKIAIGHVFLAFT